MPEYISALAQAKLFYGIEPKEIAGLLSCLRARCALYAKDDIIIEEGSSVAEFGIMLSGHGRSIKWDSSDKVIIVTLLQRGSEIGVMLAARPAAKSPVAVQALDDVSVLHIAYEHLIARCHKACPGHETLLRNYMGIVAEKGLILHERISCLLKPTVREKVLTYLQRISREQQSQAFTIPLNRNAMAEYLNVERSALSRELSNMKRDGLIDYYRDSFRIKARGDGSLVL